MNGCSSNSRAAEALRRKLQGTLVHGGIQRAARRAGLDEKRAYNQTEGVQGNPWHVSLLLEQLPEAPVSVVGEVGNEIFRPLGFVVLPQAQAEAGDVTNVYTAKAELHVALGRFERLVAVRMSDGVLDGGECVELIPEMDALEARVRSLRKAIEKGAGR